MSDPMTRPDETPLTAEAVAMLRTELKQAWNLYKAAKAELDMRGATIDMACHRLSGSVEGAPPHRGNFLQRIDELVAGEAARDALRTAVETMLKSAHPHPSEHPAMTKAWSIGRAALVLATMGRTEPCCDPLPGAWQFVPKSSLPASTATQVITTDAAGQTTVEVKSSIPASTPAEITAMEAMPGEMISVPNLSDPELAPDLSAVLTDEALDEIRGASGMGCDCGLTPDVHREAIVKFLTPWLAQRDAAKDARIAELQRAAIGCAELQRQAEADLRELRAWLVAGSDATSIAYRERRDSHTEGCSDTLDAVLAKLDALQERTTTP